jgi:type 1 glutamine amidotransferase
MTTVNNNNRPHVLVVSGGHPFAEEPFRELFAADDGIDCTHAQVPAAREWFHPERANTWDAMVCYDMQGFEFRKPELPKLLTPPADYAAGVAELLERGQGIVFLHHAMSAWPTWPLWAEVVGGRWNYVPSELDGKQWPASGYTREIEHHITCLDPSHPICAGLEDGFDITDEIYLNPVLEGTFTPLLKSNYPMKSENFFSGELAMRDRLYDNEGWSHPDGAGYMGWVKTAGNSPIVYLQCGHGPSAYGNAGFRRLLGNAIRWVASPEAHTWAQQHATALTV